MAAGTNPAVECGLRVVPRSRSGPSRATTTIGRPAASIAAAITASALDRPEPGGPTTSAPLPTSSRTGRQSSPPSPTAMVSPLDPGGSGRPASAPAAAASAAASADRPTRSGTGTTRTGRSSSRCWAAGRTGRSAATATWHSMGSGSACPRGGSSTARPGPRRAPASSVGTPATISVMRSPTARISRAVKRAATGPGTDGPAVASTPTRWPRPAANRSTSRCAPWPRATWPSAARQASRPSISSSRPPEGRRRSGGRGPPSSVTRRARRWGSSGPTRVPRPGWSASSASNPSGSPTTCTCQPRCRPATAAVRRAVLRPDRGAPTTSRWPAAGSHPTTARRRSAGTSARAMARPLQAAGPRSARSTRSGSGGNQGGAGRGMPASTAASLAAATNRWAGPGPGPADPAPTTAVIRPAAPVQPLEPDHAGVPDRTVVSDAAGVPGQ